MDYVGAMVMYICVHMEIGATHLSMDGWGNMAMMCIDSVGCMTLAMDVVGNMILIVHGFRPD